MFTGKIAFCGLFYLWAVKNSTNQMTTLSRCSICSQLLKSTAHLSRAPTAISKPFETGWFRAQKKLWAICSTYIRLSCNHLLNVNVTSVFRFQFKNKVSGKVNQAYTSQPYLRMVDPNQFRESYAQRELFFDLSGRIRHSLANQSITMNCTWTNSLSIK